MNSKDYIKSRINKIINLFPTTRVRYEFIDHLKTHLLMVQPLDVFELNNEYKDLEADISIEFDNLFSPESILFVSEDSLNSVNNPELDIEGLLYGSVPKMYEIENNIFDWSTQDYICGDNNYALAA